MPRARVSGWMEPGDPANPSTDALGMEGSTMTEITSEAPVLDLLAIMTAASLEASSLEADELMLVRIAALVAVDAPPASYLLNLGLAGELGVTADDVEGLLAAVAPIVGTTRIVSAVGKLVRAFDLKLELGELEQYIEG